MTKRITQRELRNESGRIMSELDRGATFVVTRNGVPVGDLTPVRQHPFVSRDALVAAFAGAPRIDRARFREDVDALIDPEARPRD